MKQISTSSKARADVISVDRRAELPEDDCGNKGEWYRPGMGGTYSVVMGDRGRLVVPADVRERLRLEPGTSLVLVEAGDGIVLLTREQLKRRVRSQLAGGDLVGELLDERRQAAVAEDIA